MRIKIFDAGRRNHIKSGYGLMAKQISANLIQLGHNISFFPRIENEPIEDIALWIRPPHYIEYPEFKLSKKNVFFTMHETETFKGWKTNWPSLLNKCDSIIVPTEWNKQVFIKNGVKVPIFVVPLGVNKRDFHGAKTQRFSIMAFHDALGSLNSREDWQTTISAYCEAFPNNEEVLLTIKSYNIKRTEYYKYIAKYKYSSPIEVVEIDLDTPSLNNLFSSHWLFVKNAIREGFSLPLLQAISCHLQVVFTDIPALNWAKGYEGSSIFQLGKKEQLKAIFQKKYKRWKNIQKSLDNFSWKKCTKGVENVLKKT